MILLPLQIIYLRFNFHFNSDTVKLTVKKGGLLHVFESELQHSHIVGRLLLNRDQYFYIAGGDGRI